MDERPTAQPPLRLLRLALHLLVAALLTVAVARAVAGAERPAALVLAAAAAFAAVYAAGAVAAMRGPRGAPAAAARRSAGRGRRRPLAAAWLAALAAAWVALLAASADGVWLAFPLFLLELHVLAPRRGLLAVAATTAVAVAGFALHQGPTVAGALGPAIGASATVAAALGYRALHRESEARRRLIEELAATRGELAAAGHAAGVAAERERLAREIHDTLAQGLSSIQLLLRAAERTLPERPDTALAAAHVRRARSTALHDLAEARRFVRALAPPGLDGGSLPAALERLCATTADSAALAVAFRLDGRPGALSTPHEVALLRIAQSALANAVQHAGAAHATVTLRCDAGAVALEVADDGVGFDPAALPAAPAGAEAGGFGLAAMRARVDQLGGTLRIDAAPGRGTIVTAAFPRPPAAADPPPAPAVGPRAAAPPPAPAAAARPDPPAAAGEAAA